MQKLKCLIVQWYTRLSTSLLSTSPTSLLRCLLTVLESGFEAILYSSIAVFSHLRKHDTLIRTRCAETPWLSGGYHCTIYTLNLYYLHFSKKDVHLLIVDGSLDF